MKTESVYLAGKAKWARFNTPDEYGFWGVVLYFAEGSPTYKIITDLKEQGLMNHINKDEDGCFVKLRRPTSREYKGKVKGFAPPVVLEADGKSLCRELVGNGSDITCKMEVYGFTNPSSKKPAIAWRLDTVRVDNLVIYAPQKDMDPAQLKQIEGMAEQLPQQFF